MFSYVLANLQFASKEYKDLQSDNSWYSIKRITNAYTHSSQIVNSAEQRDCKRILFLCRV